MRYCIVLLFMKTLKDLRDGLSIKEMKRERSKAVELNVSHAGFRHCWIMGCLVLVSGSMQAHSPKWSPHVEMLNIAVSPLLHMCTYVCLKHCRPLRFHFVLFINAWRTDGCLPEKIVISVSQCNPSWRIVFISWGSQCWRHSYQS